MRYKNRTISADPFDFARIELLHLPFRFFGCDDVLDADIAAELLHWFRECSCWKPHDGGFYHLHNFSLLKAQSLPESLHCLRSPSTLEQLKQRMSNVFGCTLGARVDVVGQRMEAGHQVGIHTDYRAGMETHRLLLYVGDDWQLDNGGLLLFFDRPVEEAVQLGIPPNHRSAVGFEISKRSHHAVSPILSGTRYALCYSFYPVEVGCSASSDSGESDLGLTSH